MAHYEERTLMIVHQISDTICAELRALSGEYWSPSFSTDQSDSELTFRRERIEFLRRTRHDFENAMFGIGKDYV